MKKKPRFSDYKIINLDRLAGTKVITFGTNLFMRNDNRALRIVFPCGQTLTFCPSEEIEKLSLR